MKSYDESLKNSLQISRREMGVRLLSEAQAKSDRDLISSLDGYSSEVFSRSEIERIAALAKSTLEVQESSKPPIDRCNNITYKG